MAANNVLIKSPHTRQTYTEKQLTEFAKCMDLKNGHLHFLTNYFYIQHPVKGKLLFNPYPFQYELLNAYHNYRLSINMISRQCGKALSLDTKIPTPTGWTTMGEVSVGDLVLGNDGNPTTVISATDVMYDHDCYDIKFDNGEIITADAEHLWEVGCHKWVHATKIMTTAEIIEYSENNKGVGFYITLTQAVKYENKALPINPYDLGLWLTSKDSDEKLLDHKHIPDEYMRSSVYQRLQLLRGLMDNNGKCRPSSQCRFFSTDINLINQVRELLAALGIKSKLTHRFVNKECHYAIVFKTGKFDVFTDPRNREKQKLIRKNQRNNRIYFRSFTKVKSVPVKCIQVDNPQHMFLCSNSMIPTHNSTCAAGYLLWYAMFVPDQTILVAAHKFAGSQEIMQRIRYAYELCPDHIRAGVISYNKGSIDFDNGSRIISTTTTENTGRGLSISLLYCLDGDTMVRIRNKHTLVEEDISLVQLYIRLNNLTVGKILND